MSEAWCIAVAYIAGIACGIVIYHAISGAFRA